MIIFKHLLLKCMQRALSLNDRERVWTSLELNVYPHTTVWWIWVIHHIQADLFSFFFYFLCINSSLIWLFINFYFFFYHDLGGCSVWSVAGSQSTPDGQTLNPVIKYEYFIYNTESNPLVHPHVETQGLLELQGVTVAITAPLNASDHLTVHADYHSFVKLLILIWERWRCWIAS